MSKQGIGHRLCRSLRSAWDQKGSCWLRLYRLGDLLGGDGRRSVRQLRLRRFSLHRHRRSIFRDRTGHNPGRLGFLTWSGKDTGKRVFLRNLGDGLSLALKRRLLFLDRTHDVALLVGDHLAEGGTHVGDFLVFAKILLDSLIEQAFALSRQCGAGRFRFFLLMPSYPFHRPLQQTGNLFLLPGGIRTLGWRSVAGALSRAIVLDLVLDQIQQGRAGRLGLLVLGDIPGTLGGSRLLLALLQQIVDGGHFHHLRKAQMPIILLDRDGDRHFILRLLGCLGRRGFLPFGLLRLAGLLGGTLRLPLLQLGLALGGDPRLLCALLLLGGRLLLRLLSGGLSCLELAVMRFLPLAELRPADVSGVQRGDNQREENGDQHLGNQDQDDDEEGDLRLVDPPRQHVIERFRPGMAGSRSHPRQEIGGQIDDDIQGIEEQSEETALA